MAIIKQIPSVQLNHTLRRPVNLSLKDTVFVIIILVLLITNIYSGFKYYQISEELNEAKQSLEAQQLNEKVLAFAKLFIAKVLRTEGEVSFEDRLKLENGVRALEDNKIFEQWNKFVESQTEEQAQKEVKILLEMLINKISPE